MGLVRSILAAASVVGLLIRAAFVAVFAVVAWLFVGELVGQGDLPAEPLGLAAAGLPGTVLGIPTVYAAAIGAFGLLLFFGDGSGSSHSGGFDGGDGGGGGGE